MQSLITKQEEKSDNSYSGLHKRIIYIPTRTDTIKLDCSIYGNVVEVNLSLNSNRDIFISYIWNKTLNDYSWPHESPVKWDKKCFMENLPKLWRPEKCTLQVINITCPPDGAYSSKHVADWLKLSQDLVRHFNWTFQMA